MTGPLSGMSTLLTTLSQAAHPDEVATALVRGPGAAYGATSAAILWRSKDELFVLGLDGYRPSEVEGFASLDLHGDYPLTRAFWEGEVIIDPSATVAEHYAAMRRPQSRWRSLAERIPDGCLVSAPIISDGRPIGTYALNCASVPDWSTLDIAVLDAISYALGLWLTHPDSGLPVSGFEADRPEASLSSRQVAILRMVFGGRTNTSIAAALGVSLSTVKQDLTKAMAHLGTTDRTSAAEAARALGLFDERREEPAT